MCSVGVRIICGMYRELKSASLEDLKEAESAYVTAITRPQIETLIDTGRWGADGVKGVRWMPCSESGRSGPVACPLPSLLLKQPYNPAVPLRTKVPIEWSCS